ncbi:MAG TPA: FAD-dependent oxidoreductase [Candidatus Aquilonibacter sp.]|nr:FAD-dependent oxidoreductase [Candidatus Aquilonibacter sp.]
MKPVLTYDIGIAGAGIIGLSLALELNARGASVAVLDARAALGGASTAAAGMLAADDPHHPPQLHQLARYSVSLYDRFLANIAQRSGLAVPYQTHTTIQYQDDGSSLTLAEKSVDPRQLAAAALEAARRSGIRLIEHCRELQLDEDASGIRVQPLHGSPLHARSLVHASGAWYRGTPAIAPRKGQMLRVGIPASMPLHAVHRSSSIYIVPRTHGPQAGSALIGATEEDAGFDVRVAQSDLDQLRSRAAALLPELASPHAAPQLEAWAGLRPATADRLPVIGRLSGHQWIAGGHFRNGILLAPATAFVLADLLDGKVPAVDLSSFNPRREMDRVFAHPVRYSITRP